MGVEPLQTVVGDWNGDGKPDIAALAQSDFALPGYVIAHLGNGDGTFQKYVSTEVSCRLACLVTPAKLRDGRRQTDLLHWTTMEEWYLLQALLSNGDGTFSPGNVLPGSSAIYSFTVGDFGNGHLDLVGDLNTFYSPVPYGLYIWPGNGDGTFAEPIPIVLNNNPLTPLVVGDFNHDGKLDVAVAQGTSSCGTMVSVYLGNGDLTFQSPVNSCLTFGSGLVAADFNRDGNLDLATGGENGIAVFLGNGDGSFQTTPITTPISQTISLWATADFNRDGKLDLAGTYSDSTSSGVAVLAGNGDGTFSEQPLLIPDGMTLSSNSLAVADFNGDGKPDIVVSKANFTGTGHSPGTLAVYLNSTNRKKPRATLSSSRNPSAYGETVTFTATVNPVPPAWPKETITFYSGTNKLGPARLENGIATFSTSKLPAGTLSITAAYSGDCCDYMPATSPVLSQTVNEATTRTTLSSSLNPSTYGQSVTFTAKVSPEYTGTPGGSVTFKFGTKTLAILNLSGGVASYTTSTLPKGSDVITATYEGSGNFQDSASVTEKVN